MKNKDNVIAWANERNLIKKENSMMQYIKVLEETNEIGAALVNKDIVELEDALGDTCVTLIILAEQNGLDLEKCLETAYNVIKNRTGRTVNGTFIKD